MLPRRIKGEVAVLLHLALSAQFLRRRVGDVEARASDDDIELEKVAVVRHIIEARKEALPVAVVIESRAARGDYAPAAEVSRRVLVWRVEVARRETVRRRDEVTERPRRIFTAKLE